MTEAAKTDNRNADIFTRSMKAMPPGATVREWLENTREGQFITIARDLSPAALDAWLEIAHLMAPAELRPDADLLRLCAEWDALHAAAHALADDDEEGISAAMRRCWAVSDRIEAIVPVTVAGRAAKAQVAVTLLIDNGWNDGSEAGGDERFALATLRQVAAGGVA